MWPNSNQNPVLAQVGVSLACRPTRQQKLARPQVKEVCAQMSLTLDHTKSPSYSGFSLIPRDTRVRAPIRYVLPRSLIYNKAMLADGSSLISK